MAAVVTVNDVLDGHVVLDLEVPGSDLSSSHAIATGAQSQEA